MAETRRCTRVTGKAFEPHYWTLPEERQGPRRPKDEVDQSRVGMNRVRPVWDVLCGSSPRFWIKPHLSNEITYCCEWCLSDEVDRLSRGRGGGSMVVGRIQQPCVETDKFGGHCVYVEDHVLPHRFEGGDEDARHDEALERYHLEKQQREEAVHDEVEESLASRMGHPGGHYG